LKPVKHCPGETALNGSFRKRSFWKKVSTASKKMIDSGKCNQTPLTFYRRVEIAPCACCDRALKTIGLIQGKNLNMGGAQWRVRVGEPFWSAQALVCWV
jgi:hypothetical protein